jgi:hypothetical protein
MIYVLRFKGEFYIYDNVLKISYSSYRDIVKMIENKGMIKSFLNYQHRYGLRGSDESIDLHLERAELIVKTTYNDLTLELIHSIPEKFI